MSQQLKTYFQKQWSGEILQKIHKICKKTPVSKSLFFNKIADLRPSISQVFFDDFAEVFKNIFFVELLRWLLLCFQINIEDFLLSNHATVVVQLKSMCYNDSS